MKSNLIFGIFLFAGLISCTSEKAVDFRKKITDKEQIVFNALIKENGYEPLKSRSLSKRNYDEALTYLEKEEQFFDSVIKDISSLSTDNIKEGAPVKTAAVHYYESVKELFLIDRQSIRQQKIRITFSKNPEKVDKASDSILQITRKKLDLFELVDVRNQTLQKALKKFDQANNLE